MAPSTTTRSTTTGTRVAGLLATATLASLLTVTPAFARPDPGEPLPTSGTSTSRPDGSILQYSPPSTAPRSLPSPTTVVIDDDAVEYLQIALGALAGMAAVGAVVAAGSVRRHAHVHPA